MSGSRIHWGQRGRAPVAVAALGLPIVAASVLVACGGGSSGAPAQTGAVSPAGAVSVTTVSGLGPTLVDAGGKTLYFADQEAGGSILCTGDCLGFWSPAAATGGQTPGLASVQRPDNGQQQLTYQGKPLYTFRLDATPGQHAGDNVADDFGGRHFTWHAAIVGSAPQQVAPSPSTQSGGGYGY
ncbi:MAG TPA: hypothetical protein VJ870_14480 [Amycolatopsis sp.]|nr:hypothetical protein [Amycolatopsis sp.]